MPRPAAFRATALSVTAPTSLHRPTKSRIVQKWMLGVSCQVSGRLSVTGIRPRNISCERMLQCPKFGKETMARLPIRTRCSSTAFGWRVAWMVCERMT